MIQAGTREFWRATLALSIGAFLVFANLYFTQPLLPVFTREFHIAPVTASLSLSVTTFSLGLSLLFFGPLSDALGRKKIMAITMVCVATMAFLLSSTTSFSAFLLYRFIAGFFLAGIPSIAIAYIGEEFSRKSLVSAIGIYISGTSIGGMGGRLICGFATDLFGWRNAFLAMGAISILCLLLFIYLLPASRNFQASVFKPGKIIGDFSKHIRNPLLLSPYLIGGLCMFLFVGEYNFITFHLSGAPFYLPTAFVGMLFLTYLAGTLSSSLSGKWAQRIPLSLSMGIGIAVMALGITFTLIGNLWMILFGLLVNSFGFFMAHSTASAWVSRHAAFAKASASSLYLLFYYIGGSLGSFYLGFFYHWKGWPALVAGALLVLSGIGWIVLRLYGLEKRENPLLVASKNPIH